jgi:hypothetical protein
MIAKLANAHAESNQSFNVIFELHVCPSFKERLKDMNLNKYATITEKKKNNVKKAKTSISCKEK